MRLFLAAAFLLTSSAALMADDIIFSPMTEESPAYDLVRSFVGDEPASVAFVDLNGDDSMEVLARVGTDCDSAPCRTIVYAEGRTDWGSVLDRPAVMDIEIGDPGMSRMKTIYADGVAWKWEVSSYVADVAGSGSNISMSLVPTDYVQPLLEQFGEGAVRLFEANRNATLTYGSVRAGEDETSPSLIVVKLEGAGACGRVFGCPIRLLEIRDGSYFPVLEGFADSDIVLGNTVRGGMKDIITSLPGRGFVAYGWSGSVYGQIDSMQGN